MEPMGERGRQGAAPLGGTDIETVREALQEAAYVEPPAFEALSRIERVVEAAREAERVLDTMLGGSWPIPRLASRLTRLRAILREALGALDG